MTPTGPEWRRSEGEAVLDAEVKQWDKYRIVTTTVTPWKGKREVWHKAEKTGQWAERMEDEGMKWIATEDRLPAEGDWVLGYEPNAPIGKAPFAAHCTMVRLVCGITMEERERMVKGEIPDPIISTYTSPADTCKIGEWIEHKRKRSELYQGADAWKNNQRAYSWDGHGPFSFSGQAITHWTPVPTMGDE